MMSKYPPFSTLKVMLFISGSSPFQNSENIKNTKKKTILFQGDCISKLYMLMTMKAGATKTSEPSVSLLSHFPNAVN